jgi:hypothetical protein
MRVTCPYETVDAGASSVQGILRQRLTVKCDCEDGEYTIIEQLTPAMAARIRNLSVEAHDLDWSHNLQTLSAKLSSLGYKLSCIPDMWERSALHLLLARRSGLKRSSITRGYALGSRSQRTSTWWGIYNEADQCLNPFTNMKRRRPGGRPVF